jgi:hypothetical protein
MSTLGKFEIASLALLVFLTALAFVVRRWKQTAGRWLRQELKEMEGKLVAIKAGLKIQMANCMFNAATLHAMGMERRTTSPDYRKEYSQLQKRYRQLKAAAGIDQYQVLTFAQETVIEAPFLRIREDAISEMWRDLCALVPDLPLSGDTADVLRYNQLLSDFKEMEPGTSAARLAAADLVNLYPLAAGNPVPERSYAA